MSREVIIRIRDDLDRSDASATIEFSYRGVDYEIDLSDANAERFDKSVEEFVQAARRVERVKEVAAPTARKFKKPPPSYPVSQATKQQRHDIRSWAITNGFQIQERGMIASAVVDAFLLANPGVTLLPDTVSHYPARRPAIEKVSAQDAQDGLISASALLHDQTARNRKGEELSRPERTKIREWANQNGYDQAMVGHIKREVLAAYYEAHPGED